MLGTLIWGRRQAGSKNNKSRHPSQLTEDFLVQPWLTLLSVVFHARKVTANNSDVPISSSDLQKKVGSPKLLACSQHVWSFNDYLCFFIAANLSSLFDERNDGKKWQKNIQSCINRMYRQTLCLSVKCKGCSALCEGSWRSGALWLLIYGQVAASGQSRLWDSFGRLLFTTLLHWNSVFRSKEKHRCSARSFT